MSMRDVYNGRKDKPLVSRRQWVALVRALVMLTGPLLEAEATGPEAVGAVALEQGDTKALFPTTRTHQKPTNYAHLGCVWCGA
jgi:hypothetical protein